MPQPLHKAKTTLTPEKQERFLTLLAEGWTAATAAPQTGVTRQCAYELRARDPDFEARWLQAVEARNDRMEAEAYRRAVEGIEERRYDKDGNLIDVVRKYSDVLLMFLMKANDPAKYRDNSRVELAGADGAQVLIAIGGNVGRSDPQTIDVSPATRQLPPQTS